MTKPLCRAYAVVLAGVLIVSAGCGRLRDPGSPSVAAGNAVVIDGRQLLNLLQDARGRVVVMNVWATWCVPCVAEMAELARFAGTYEPKGVAFISVSVDDPGTLGDRVQPFLRQHSAPFGAYVLSDRSPDTFVQGLKSRGLNADWSGAVPATFVFDQAGQLRQWWFEGVTDRELAAAVDALVSR